MKDEKIKTLFLEKQEKRKVNFFKSFMSFFMIPFPKGYDDYLKLNQQLKNRKEFPVQSWAPYFFCEDIERIKKVCFRLKQWGYWDYPFFIPDDPLKYFLFADGDYDCYSEFLLSVHEEFGVDLVDSEVERQMAEGYTLKEFFEHIMKVGDREK